MSKRVSKAILVLVVQLALVCSLAGKYAYDRATRPKIWVQTTSYDPSLPVRGRYAALQLEILAGGDLFPPAGTAKNSPCPSSSRNNTKGPRFYSWETEPVRLEIQNGKLIAYCDPKSDVRARWLHDVNGVTTVTLQDPIYFYVPEHALNMPTWLSRSQWWAEVTIPKKGPPRPLRLGTRQGDGPIVPAAPV